MELGRAYTSTKLWRRQLSRAENELLLGRNTAVAQSLPAIKSGAPAKACLLGMPSVLPGR